jgi:hypothetical protein
MSARTLTFVKEAGFFYAARTSRYSGSFRAAFFFQRGSGPRSFALEKGDCRSRPFFFEACARACNAAFAITKALLRRRSGSLDLPFANTESPNSADALTV